MFYSFRFAISLLLLFSFHSYAQVNDDFSDGDFTGSPAWSSSNISGNGADFQVLAGELQSNGPAATSTIWLSTAGIPNLSSGIIVWEFKVRYSSSPSSSNNVEVFLASDQSDLDNNPIGYFVRLGESGSGDGIDLFKTSSSTAIISDPNASIASGIDVNIRVTRNTAGLWTLEADATGGTTFTTIGSTTDTEFVAGSHFGFKVEHTSTRNQDFFFDDINVSVTDVSPPALTQIEVLSNTELRLTFSEELEPVGTENTANYIVDQGVGQPTYAEFTSGNVVHLTFSNPFLNAQLHELTVTNITDLNGNNITAATSDFLYFQEVPAVSKDIIINEIFADPDPPNDLPEAEYIEIMNNSDKVFDLSGWTFSDQTTVTTLQNHFLFPGEFLILCSGADSTNFVSFGHVLGLSSWPSLNNTGDYLYLRDNHGTTIDSVNYTTAWYQNDVKADGGWSLEIINPDNTCHVSSNWKASENSSGGTPGRQNSVFDLTVDQEGPSLVSAWVVNDKTLNLTFDEPLDPGSITVSGFHINSSISVVSITQEEQRAQLSCELSSAIPGNTLFEITIEGVFDCNGNVISNHNMMEFILVADVAISEKDVIINEIFPSPDEEANPPQAEYIELHNNSDKILNLDGWMFSDASSSGEIIELILFPGDYVVLCDEQDMTLFSSFAKVAGLKTWPTLNNSGDNLVLRNGSGELVDSVSYDSRWYNSSEKSAGGWALELIDPANRCSDSRNWTASESNFGGTPGEENSVLSDKPDLTGPELVEAMGIAPDSVRLKFNEALDVKSIITALYKITPETTITGIFPGADLLEVTLVSSLLERGVLYTATVEHLTDCNGNIIGRQNSKDFKLIESADSSDIVINEILFNPRKGGVDFIELYNQSDKHINLKKWILANGEIHGDTIEPDQYRTLTKDDYIIAPSEYVSVTTDEILLKEEYPFGREDRFLKCTSLPAFPNEEGVAIIMNPDSLWLDSLGYSADWHFDLLSDEEGVSLERVSVQAPTNQADNWKSAASTVGFATPGYHNSQSRPDITNQGGEISIEPKVVIPDGNGQNDFATISYSFEKSGYVANVKILDLQGRTIRILGENDYLAAEGFYTWDATDDNGRKARVGYYLVYFEVFDLEGETQQYKKKVVVGTRF